MAKVYLLGLTQLTQDFNEFLDDLGHKDWVENGTKHTDLLVETAGRLCYRSWAPYEEGDDELNANIEKVRHGNKKYIANILSSGHGSVLEHINFTFLLRGVSRVLTHELVRHRAGMAYSQESLRYCRLEKLTLIIPPDSLPTNKDEETRELMENVAETARCAIDKLNRLLLEDVPDFATKKAMTSLIRRIAPIGLSTNILFTANARALRHIITMRTNPAAEIEIRQVFEQVVEKALIVAPNLLQDIDRLPNGEFKFANL
ncbi:MAG: FAD-dependent thymidylate synthase [Euryarchaeota archaeon]|nr:FAD-dependent thymidylate synthase [Euryarchaeota archaeon]